MICQFKTKKMKFKFFLSLILIKNYQLMLININYDIINLIVNYLPSSRRHLNGTFLNIFVNRYPKYYAYLYSLKDARYLIKTTKDALKKIIITSHFIETLHMLKFLYLQTKLSRYSSLVSLRLEGCYDHPFVNTNTFLFPNFTKLKFLSCHNCFRLTDIPEKYIQLRYLYCENCLYLAKIPETLINLKKLIIINSCKDPFLQKCSLSPKFVNLKYLNISQSYICRIPETYVNLTYLNCSDTCIHDIPAEFINLKKLNVEKTQVEIIPDLPNLIELNCSTSRVYQLSPKLINLKILICNRCPIAKIPITLVNLQSLCCVVTNIISIPKELINLKYLLRNFIEIQMPDEIKNQIEEYIWKPRDDDDEISYIINEYNIVRRR
jgi:hypothetical protein